MPGITIDFTEDELAELRAEAEERCVSVGRMAHDAIVEALGRRHGTAEAPRAG